MKTIHKSLTFIITLLFYLSLEAKQTDVPFEPVQNDAFKWTQVNDENAELKIEKKQEEFNYAIKSKIGQYEYEDLDFTDSYIVSLNNEELYRVIFSSSFTLNDTMWLNFDMNYKDSLKSSFDPLTRVAYKRKNTKQESIMKLYYQPNSVITTHISLENVSNTTENDQWVSQNLKTIGNNKISLNVNTEFDFIHIKTSLFQIIKSNDIYENSKTNENLEKTQELYRGIELTLSKHIFEDLKLSTSAKVRSVEIQESNIKEYVGNTPSYTPNSEVDVKAEYLFEDIKFTGKMTHIGNRYSDGSNNNTLSSYTIGSVGATFFTQFYDEDVKVDFNIKNIMNRNYDIYSDTKGDSRNYMLNLLMIF